MWEQIPEKARKIPRKYVEISWWTMHSKAWFEAREKDLGKLQMKILRSREQGCGCRKRQRQAEKDKRLTKHALKYFTITTHSHAISKHHIKQKHIKLIYKILQNTIFYYLNLWKLELVLESFIQIFKSFVLFSVCYWQHKIRNFGVWQLANLPVVIIKTLKDIAIL